MQRTRLPGSIFGLCAASALLVACGGGGGDAGYQQPGQQTTQQQAPPTSQAPAPKETSGTFQKYQPTVSAITYDPEQVPIGSRIKVSSQQVDGKTRVALEAQGLRPDRDYGAHVHVNQCGQEGDEAGPHYQEKPDPVKPSVDPAFANPQNEVWLDFRTDAQGNGKSTAEGSWSLSSRGDAQSVVLHAHRTSSAHGEAGEAGDRLACITADF
ncbi:superoxide dismutase family protein [Saccharopolyspora griseoalba]|uniref:Superoxide dismutase family protein n=1 Tax=Saccharopolyspora griseoalba TaxID=1431848 RepID=A0ABW2LK07_9PSEU